MIHPRVDQYRWFIYPWESSYELKKGKFKTSVMDCKVKPKRYNSIQEKLEIKENSETIEEEDSDEENPLFAISLFGEVKEKKEKLWKFVPKFIIKQVTQAIDDYEMIKEGDRLLLGLSGGKDSLTMLHILKIIQKKSKVNFTFGACTIDPQTSVFDPSGLKDYCKSLGVEYFYESHAIIELAKEHNQSSICSWCSRMKRGILYNTCRTNNYNVLVLAQHLDDIVESFMMSVFHNGYLRTMKANYVVDEGDLRVIRPLVYCRESKLKEFAYDNGLPVVFESCPACFSQVPTERMRIKKLLKEQEHLFENLYTSFKNALRPLMKKDLDGFDGKVFKKFKTRKQKDEEEKNQCEDFIEEKVPEKDENYKGILSGLPKNLEKQINILSNIKYELLENEIQKRKKYKYSLK